MPKPPPEKPKPGRPPSPILEFGTVNWRAFDEHVQRALRRGEKHPDAEVVSVVSWLTRLTPDEVEERFPTLEDILVLGELLQLVDSGDSQDEKASRLIARVTTLATVVVRLISPGR
jgi:hypothetical protein